MIINLLLLLLILFGVAGVHRCRRWWGRLNTYISVVLCIGICCCTFIVAFGMLSCDIFDRRRKSATVNQFECVLQGSIIHLLRVNAREHSVLLFFWCIIWFNFLLAIVRAISLLPFPVSISVAECFVLFENAMLSCTSLYKKSVSIRLPNDSLVYFFFVIWFVCSCTMLGSFRFDFSVILKNSDRSVATQPSLVFFFSSLFLC